MPLRRPLLLKISNKYVSCLRCILKFKITFQVHNLLAVVCSRLRQHAFLASLLNRAIQYSGANRYMWRQLGLALASTGRNARAITVLRHGTALEGPAAAAKESNGTSERDDNNQTPEPTGSIDERIIEHMAVARLLVEQPTDEPEIAMQHAKKVMQLCRADDALKGRCALLYALAFRCVTIKLVASSNRLFLASRHELHAVGRIDARRLSSRLATSSTPLNTIHMMISHTSSALSNMLNVS